MTNRERVIATLNGKDVDRCPQVEWAGWWDQTLDRWHKEGLEKDLSTDKIFELFNIDPHYQLWPSIYKPGFSLDKFITCEEDYEEILPTLYSNEVLENLRKNLLEIKAKHDSGENFVWFTLEGYFWFPRKLFGIEEHLFAFYDHADLMKRINEDLCNYHIKVIDTIFDVLTPEFMTFAEDMSYNLGPMISKELYDEFLAPYYKRIVPLLKEKGTKAIIDTDGNIEQLVPWFEETGLEGVLPLERQAGTDINSIRENFPEFIMIGGFDKTVMHKGEEAIRKEFERILPVIKSGRYIPSVDHQTPPEVSMEDYKLYLKLMKEYTEK